jgi:uncharacterized protein YuzE
MAPKSVKIRFDREGDYLEVLFDSCAGYMRETADDRVMARVDQDGNLIGFEVMGLSRINMRPINLELP